MSGNGQFSWFVHTYTSSVFLNKSWPGVWHGCSRYDKPVKGRKINWMKAAFLESDMNLTVSPNYAQELTRGADKGGELDPIILETGITGIVNGMDVQEWDPSADKHLDVPYDISTVY